MPDNDNGEIGRGVIGAMVMQRLAAICAMVLDLQIAAEHPAFATGRTAKQPSAEEGGANRAGPLRAPVRGRDRCSDDRRGGLHAFSYRILRSCANPLRATRPFAA